jgi:hypothetical protein
MARYILLAMNGPTNGEGDESLYIDWYNEVHIPAIKNIDGIIDANRFKVIRGKVPGELWPYLTIYEIETDDMSRVSAELAKAMQMWTPALNSSKSAHLFAMLISES